MARFETGKSERFVFYISSERSLFCFRSINYMPYRPEFYSGLGHVADDWQIDRATETVPPLPPLRPISIMLIYETDRFAELFKEIALVICWMC